MTAPARDISPIETRYADCLFRSRLEARWAVFFDTLGIEWQYEAQGYVCQPRCHLSGTAPFRYLPDFWLPQWELFAEVKGQLKPPETCQLLDAAAYLSAPSDGCGYGNDLVVLGQVPRSDVPSRFPVLLHMHKGILTGYPWQLGRVACCGEQAPLVIATDGDESISSVRVLHDPGAFMTAFLVNGLSCRPGELSYRWQQILSAFGAARSARFEHGQSGAV